MKRKNEAGFSLIETLVAIVILTGIVVPVLTSLMLSMRLNAKAEEILQARIAVSSAVETLKSEGITGESDNYADGRFPGVTISTTERTLQPVEFEDEKGEAEGEGEGEGEEEATPILYYEVKASYDNGLAEVTACIRAAGEGGTK